MFPRGTAYYGKSAKSRELYSSQAPLVAASQGVEKVTLLLNSFPVKASVSTNFLMHNNSFPVKARASPLSDFEELVTGVDSPVSLPGLLIGSPPDEGRTLTAEEGLNLSILPAPMSLEEQIAELTRQLRDLQSQLATQSLPQTAAPAPVPPHHAPAPKPPKVAAPTPFSGSQEDLDRFKAECGLYMSMRHTEFQDERSQVLFVLSYMKGGTAGPWATQCINTLLAPGAPNIAFDDFADELDSMFADPNRQATARCRRNNGHTIKHQYGFMSEIHQNYHTSRKNEKRGDLEFLRIFTKFYDVSEHRKLTKMFHT
jgi:hypothetical protein